MPTKDKSKKKNLTKDSPKSPTKPNKKTRQAKKNENIIVEESGQGIYSIKDVNPQITDSVTQAKNSQNIVSEISNAKIEPTNSIKENNSDIMTDNVSYSNMVVPQSKDNTVLFIGLGLAFVLFLWMMFA